MISDVITYFSLCHCGWHIVDLYCELFSSFLFSWTSNIYLSTPSPPPHIYILSTFITLFHFIIITWPIAKGGISSVIFIIYTLKENYTFFFPYQYSLIETLGFSLWYTCILECDKNGFKKNQPPHLQNYGIIS